VEHLQDKRSEDFLCDAVQGPVPVVEQYMFMFPRVCRNQDGCLAATPQETHLNKRNSFKAAARLPHMLLRDLVLGHAQWGDGGPS
jgi:hypothetical protein